MSITKNAEKYHERMFPGYQSDFLRTDPDFIELFDNFAFDEVVNQEDQSLDDRTRFMSILAVLIGSSSLDEYKAMVPAAMRFGVTPVEIKEIVYQATAYLGIGRVFPFLKSTNEVFEKEGISLPLEKQATVSSDERLKAGEKAQMEIFGENMRDYWKEDHIHYWLTDYCFGDYYTRQGLTLAQREMITFCFLYAQGGCENQLRGHVAGNLRMGNDRSFLIKVVTQCIPFMGFPRSLNAIAIINEIAGNQ